MQFVWRLPYSKKPNIFHYEIKFLKKKEKEKKRDYLSKDCLGASPLICRDPDENCRTGAGQWQQTPISVHQAKNPRIRFRNLTLIAIFICNCINKKAIQINK